MSDIRSRAGWLRLEKGFDIRLVHGIPVRLSDDGLSAPTEDAQLVKEVSRLSGLQTTIVGWHEGENSGERETTLCIDASQFGEVLQRLAIFSAALFVDRYQTPISDDSVDWDREEYDCDFNMAIEHCCLGRTDLRKEDYFDRYTDAMHKESNRIIEEGISPLVEAE